MIGSDPNSMRGAFCRGKHTRLASCWAAALPVLFSVFSALVCTQSLVFNKAVMVLWRMTLDGQNQVSVMN